jgi:predicted enzyme related to lactoylglutathione lyase
VQSHRDRGPRGGNGHAPPTTTNMPFWLVPARSHVVPDPPPIETCAPGTGSGVTWEFATRHEALDQRREPHCLQLPALEVARSAAFYQAVFGWSVDLEHGSFEAPAMIGQWTTDRKPAGSAGPVLWICADDLWPTLDKVVDNGGTVHGWAIPYRRPADPVTSIDAIEQLGDRVLVVAYPHRPVRLRGQAQGVRSEAARRAGRQLTRRGSARPVSHPSSRLPVRTWFQPT